MEEEDPSLFGAAEGPQWEWLTDPAGYWAEHLGPPPLSQEGEGAEDTGRRRAPREYRVHPPPPANPTGSSRPKKANHSTASTETSTGQRDQTPTWQDPMPRWT